MITVINPTGFNQICLRIQPKIQGIFILFHLSITFVSESSNV